MVLLTKRNATPSFACSAVTFRHRVTPFSQNSITREIE